MLSVPKFDDVGLEQLACDLDYLLNVLAALGLRRHALLAHLATLARTGRDHYAAALRRPRPGPGAARPEAAARGGGLAGSSVVRKLERHFASARGIPIVFGDED